MFEAGFLEWLLCFVIGLLILGPERLPRVAAQLGRWVGKARRTANQLRWQLEREVALDDVYRAQRKKKKPQRTGTEAGASADKGGAAEPRAEDGEPATDAEHAAASASSPDAPASAVEDRPPAADEPELPAEPVVEASADEPTQRSSSAR